MMFVGKFSQTNISPKAVEVAEKFAGGRGVARNPYQITNEAEFLLFKSTPADNNQYFKLMNNIIVTSPLGDGTNGTVNMFNEFYGNFDGNNCTITYLDETDLSGNNVGGVCGTLLAAANNTGPDENDYYTTVVKSGVIKNVSVIGNFTTSGNNIGGIVGKVDFDVFMPLHNYTRVQVNAPALENVAYEGNLTGNNYVGGIVGSFNAPAFDLGNHQILQYNFNGQNAFKSLEVSSTSIIKGFSNVGGLIGAIVQEEVITSSTNPDYYFQDITYNAPDITFNATGIVDATGDYVGGIIGNYQKPGIYNTSVSDNGSISINKKYGLISSTVNQTFEVKNGRNYVGGIAGYFGGFGIDINDDFISTITTKINGAQIGGIFGFVSTESYETLFLEPVVFSTTINTVSSYVGGIVGSVSNNGYLRNVTGNVIINAKGNFIGGATGTLGSEKGAAQMENIHLTGRISGKNSVGGLLGSAMVKRLDDNSAFHMNNCTTALDVVGGSFVGGVIGGFSVATNSPNLKINNVWMSGTVKADLDVAESNGDLKNNYIYWGSFYGYQSKNTSLDPTNMYLTNSGSILDVTVLGAHQAVDVFGMLNNNLANRQIETISSSGDTTVYRIKALQGGDLGLNNEIYGFISNYNGQLVRIKKNDNRYVYVPTMDRTMALFNTDLNIDLSVLTSYGSDTNFEIVENLDNEGKLINYTVNITNALQLERLAFVLQFFIDGDGGLPISGPTAANVSIVLQGNNKTYDLTTSKGYYGDNNFYGFGWSSFGPFLGDFNGNNNIIKLNMNCPNGFEIGLFGSVSSNSGGINAIESTNEITNLTITGQIIGHSQVGSVIGFHDNYAPSLLNYDRKSTVRLSYINNMATVDGVNLVGGLLGYSNGATTNTADELNDSSTRIYLSNCLNYADVTSTGSLGTGGLIGATGWNIASTVSIQNCSNMGDVVSSGSYVGGLIGRASKKLILAGINNLYGNVSGKDKVGLVYGDIPTKVSYFVKIDDTTTEKVEVPNTVDLSTMTAYYYIALGDMSSDILGASATIDGIEHIFGNSDLFSVISWDYDKYAIYDLENWKVTGINTLNPNTLPINSYQGTFEKEAIQLEAGATTLRYELNIIKNIAYKAEESTLEKVFDLTSNSYPNDWRLMAEITYFNNVTNLVEVSYDASTINENSNELEFTNIAINDDRYALNVTGLTLRRITKDVVAYEKACLDIANYVGTAQKAQYLVAKALYDALMNVYGKTNTYLNSYLESKNASDTVLSTWASIIVDEVIVNNPLNRVTYGTAYDKYLIKYKTIDGNISSRTTEIVVSYRYARNNQNTLVGTAYFSSLSEGHNFYEVTENGLTTSFPFTTDMIIFDAIAVDKASLTIGLTNKTITYLDDFSGIVPTITGHVSTDDLTVDLLYDRSGNIPSTAGTYNVTIQSLKGTNSDYYEYNSPTCQLIINKIKVSVAFGSNNFDYNGTVQKPSVTVSSLSTLFSRDYTINEVASINAGEYTTSVTLKDSDNYEFVTTSECSYKINKINASVTLPKSLYLVGTMASDIVPSFTGLLENNPEYELRTRNDNNIIVSNAASLGAGTYYLQYLFTNYDVAIQEISVVTSISLSLATINLVKTTGVYTGTTHVIKAVVSYDGQTLVENTDYTITTITDLINVGIYTDKIIITGIGSYSGSIAKSYEITKATPVLSAENTQEFTYEERQISPLVTSNITNITLDYLFEGINGTNYGPTNLAPMRVGEYRVTIYASETPNYEQSQSIVITMKINRAPSTITGTDITTSFDGAPKDFRAVLNHQECSLSYRYVGSNYDSDVAPSDAGRYTVTVSSSETPNYLRNSQTFTLLINKQPLTFTNVVDEFDYDGNSKTVLYSLSVNNLKVVGNVTSTNATTGISYELMIDETNYEGKYVGSLVINKISPTYTIPTPSATYNDYLRSITLPTGFAWNRPNDNVGDVGNRPHLCTYTPADPLNYLVVSNIQVLVKVGPATPQYTVPSITATYGDILQDLVLPKGFTWNNPLQTVGLVGDNQHLATYTPSDSNYTTVSGISITVKVEKASQTMPAIEVVDVSINTITVTLVTGAQYRLNGGTWSNNNSFTSLQAGTTYTIEAYRLGDSNHNDSNIVEINVKTLAKSQPTITNFDNLVLTYDPDNTMFTLNPISNSNGAITYNFVSGAPRDVISISGNKVNVLRAGSVDITLNQAETAIFEAITKTITIRIDKALPAYTLPKGLEAPYGTKLKDLGLPTGFSFQDSGELAVGNVGTHTFLGKYTPTDTINYLEVTNLNLVVTVTKATPIVNPVYLGPTLYPSSSLPVIELLDTDTLGTISLDGGQRLTIGNNLYNWSFTPTDTTNYYSSTGQINLSVLAIIVDHLVITKAPNKTTYEAFEYFNPDGMVVTAVYNDGSMINISNYQYDTTTLLTSTTSINISYGGKVVGQPIVVCKKTLLFSNVVDHFVYDGNPKTITYVIGSGTLALEVRGNIIETLPQNNTQYTLTIVDDNYQGTYTGTFFIDKATPTYVIPNNIEATYLDKLVDVSLPTGFTWKQAKDVVGNVGNNSHLAIYTPQDLSLYYPVQDISVNVKVNKAIPSFSLPSLTTCYGTLLKDVELPSNFKWVTPTAVVGSVGTEKHSLIYTPTDLHNYQEITVECSIEVTKATKEAPLINVVTQTSNSVTVTLINGVNYRLDGGSWSTVNSFTDLIAGNTYTIDAYFLENNNYLASEVTTIVVTISSKVQPTISNFDNLDLIYQTNQTIKLNPSSNSSGTISYELQNANGIATLNDNVVSILKAGSFTIVLNQAQTPTFTSVSLTIRVTITKAVPEYTLPTNLEADYLDYVSNVVLPEGFTFQNIEATTLVGNVGSNRFYVTYTPNNLDCYEIVQHLAVNIKVNPILATANVSYEGGTIYTSTSILPSLTVTSSNTPGQAIIDATLPLASGTRQYKYYFIPTDKVNYLTNEGYLTLTVEKVTLLSLEVINLPDKTTYNAFESFDTKGLVIRGHYNDGSSRVVSDYDVVYQSDDTLKAQDTFVTISWQDTISINVFITVRKLDVIFTNVIDKHEYDGHLHAVTYELSVSGLMVEGVPSSTNAIKTAYTLTVVDDNYQGTHQGIFEITKAKYTNITHPTLTGVFDETKTLLNYELNSNFRWANPSIQPTCDTTSYLAYYNSDAINYEDYPVAISLVLSKKELSFNKVTSKFTYDGMPKSIIYELPVDSLNVTGNLSVINATSGIAYRLEIVDVNYQGSLTGTLIIDKASPVVEPSYEGVLYSSSMLPQLTLSNQSTKGTIVLDDAQVLKVGTFQYTWTFTPTDLANYLPLSGAIALTVNKVKLTQIVVSTKPLKLDYVAFDVFDNTGTQITAYYNDGSNKIIVDYQYQASVLVTTPTVTYEYTEDAITKTVVLNLNVSKKRPMVNPYYDGTPLYTSSSIPVLKLQATDTQGRAFINEGQPLIVGTNNYNYTFLPTDSDNYQSLTDVISLKVEAVELVALTIVNNPFQMIYDAFATFNDEGLRVEAIYNDEHRQIITDYQIAATLRFDNRNVRISYTENNITKTISLEVTVNKVKPLINPVYNGNPLYVTSDLPELTLAVSDPPGVVTLDHTNVLRVGSFEYTYTYQPFDQVNYENVTGKVTLTVLAQSISGITISRPANKLAYVALEVFDITGLEVKAINNDGSSVIITNYTIEYEQGDNVVHYGDTLVTITYGGFEVSQNITVSKASLKGLIEYQNQEIDYDGELHSLVLTTLPRGVENSDIVYANNSGILVGTYYATMTIKANDYEIYHAEAALTIAKRHLTVSYVGETTLEYSGQNFLATMVRPVVSNLATIDHSSLNSLVTMVYYHGDNAISRSEIINAGKYHVEVALTTLGSRNYEISDEITTIAITVNPAILEVALQLPVSMVYNRLPKALVNVKLKNTETIITDYTPHYYQGNTELNEAPSLVGDYRVVVVSSNPNYELVNNEGAYQITPLDVGVEFGVLSSIYNGLQVAYQPTLTKIITGDEVRPNYTIQQAGRMAELRLVGDYQVVVNGLTGRDAPNYHITTISETYRIEKCPVTVDTKILPSLYDGNSQTPTYTFMYNQTPLTLTHSKAYLDTTTGLTSSDVPVNVGTYKLILTDFDTRNYEIASEIVVDYQISPRAITITYPNDLIYQGINQTISVSFNDVLTKDLSEFTYEVRNNLLQIVNNTEIYEAGEYTIKVSYEGHNYVINSPLSHELTVEQLSLDVELTNLKNEVTYNGQSWGGFTDEEIFSLKANSNTPFLGVLNYRIKYLDANNQIIARRDIINVGTYQITIECEEDENLIITTGANAIVRIVPAMLNLYSSDGTGPQIDITETNQIYQKKILFVNYQFHGLYGDDQITPTIKYTDSFGEACAPMNVGTYRVLVTGIDNRNYRLPALGLSTYLVIDKYVLKVTAQAVSTMYSDEILTDLPYTTNALYDGDEIRGTLKTSANKLISSTYLIERGSEFGVYDTTTNAVNANYLVEYISAIYTVTKRPVNISLVDNSFIYNNMLHELQFVVEGALNNDQIIISYKSYLVTIVNNQKILTEVIDNKVAGKYEISLYLNPNYQIISLADLSYEVAKAELDLSLVIDTSIYNGQMVDYVVINDQGKNVKVVTKEITRDGLVATKVQDAGTYMISVEVDDTNYDGSADLQYVVEKAYYHDINHDDLFVTYQKDLQLHDLTLEDNYFFISPDQTITVHDDGMISRLGYNADKANYYDYELAIHIFVAKARISDFELVPATFVYDGLPHQYNLNELPEGITGIEYQNNTLTEVGITNVIITFTVNENYHPLTPRVVKLTVTRKPVTVTPLNNQQKQYTDLDPVLEYHVDGLIGNEPLTGALSRVPGEELGEYDIISGTLEVSNNYEIVFTSNVKFTIVAKTLAELSLVNNYLTYNGEVQEVTLKNATSILPSDVTYLVLEGKTLKDAGTYQIKVISNTPKYVIIDSDAILDVTINKLDISDELYLANRTITCSGTTIDVMILNNLLLELQFEKFYYLGSTSDPELEIAEVIKSGNYLVKAVVRDDNYQGVAELPFVVVKANRSISYLASLVIVDVNSFYYNLANAKLMYQVNNGSWVSEVKNLTSNTEYEISLYAEEDDVYNSSNIINFTIKTRSDLLKIFEDLKNMTPTDDTTSYIEKITNELNGLDNTYDETAIRKAQTELGKLRQANNQYRANKVIELINHAAKDKNLSLEEVAKAYEALTEDQKILVTNYNQLVDLQANRDTPVLAIVLGIIGSVALIGGAVIFVILKKKKHLKA